MIFWHLQFSSWKKEFKGNKTTLPDITPEKWAILQGLAYLLTGFERSTTILSGEKYPTFVSALPILRFIKQSISNTNMFSFAVGSDCTRRQKQFLELYGDEPFFKDVTMKLEVCHCLLYEEFCDRFNNPNPWILWCTLLDPRFNFKAAHWKSITEMEDAKTLLVREVKLLANEHQTNQHQFTALETIDLATNSQSESDDDEFSFKIYSEKKASTWCVDVSEDYHNVKEAQLNLVAAQEVESYLMEIDCPKNSQLDPLEWWQNNCNRYPNVARAARKWLSVSGTSIPSK